MGGNCRVGSRVAGIIRAGRCGEPPPKRTRLFSGAGRMGATVPALALRACKYSSSITIGGMKAGITVTERERGGVLPDARSSRLRRAVPRCAALLLAQFAAAAINASGVRTLLRGEARACSPLLARL